MTQKVNQSQEGKLDEGMLWKASRSSCIIKTFETNVDDPGESQPWSGVHRSDDDRPLQPKTWGQDKHLPESEAARPTVSQLEVSTYISSVIMSLGSRNLMFLRLTFCNKNGN
jgi:hypothetical protein